MFLKRAQYQMWKVEPLAGRFSVPWFWIGLGGVIGFINSVTQIRLVSQLHPDTSFSVRARVFRSYAIRFGLVSVGLAVAARNGLVPALGVFCSLWLVRWVIVLLGCAGVIDWVRLGISSREVG